MNNTSGGGHHRKRKFHTGIVSHGVQTFLIALVAAADRKSRNVYTPPVFNTPVVGIS